MELIKVVILALSLIAIAFLGMAVRVLLIKGGKFPNTHVSGNKYLKRNGVYCSQTQDRQEQKKVSKKVDFKNLKFKPGSIRD